MTPRTHTSPLSACSGWERWDFRLAFKRELCQLQEHRCELSKYQLCYLMEARRVVVIEQCTLSRIVKGKWHWQTATILIRTHLRRGQHDTMEHLVRMSHETWYIIINSSISSIPRFSPLFSKHCARLLSNSTPFFVWFVPLEELYPCENWILGHKAFRTLHNLPDLVEYLEICIWFCTWVPNTRDTMVM